MIEKTLYLSSIEPTVLTFTYPSLYNINFQDKTTCIVPMVTDDDNIKHVVNVPIIKKTLPYVATIWNKDDVKISWERTTINRSALGEDITIFFSSITIKYKHPSYFYTPIPYWFQTKVEVMNPVIDSSYLNYIVKQEQNTSVLEGNILDLKDIVNKDDYWIKEVPKNEQKHIESQIIARPGEYIRLAWTMTVDKEKYKEIIHEIPFETPLFTGGILLNKTGIGKDTRYTAKIYDTIYTDIIPTDFFEYELNKWAYFLKDVTLSGEHQKYSSSDININESTAKYRLTPFNFYGNPHYDTELGMAISYENDLAIDFTTEFERIFDMLNYVGKIESIDYSNDSAVVNFNTQSISLPIFYHCSSQPNIRGGSKAFKVDDDVIISCPFKANSEPDYENARIIGFPDKITPCINNVLLLQYKSQTENKLLAVNLTSQTVFELIDPNSEATYPENLIQQPFNYDDYFVKGICDFNGISINTEKTNLNSLKINPDRVIYNYEDTIQNINIPRQNIQNATSFNNEIIIDSETKTKTIQCWCFIPYPPYERIIDIEGVVNYTLIDYEYGNTPNIYEHNFNTNLISNIPNNIIDFRTSYNETGESKNYGIGIDFELSSNIDSIPCIDGSSNLERDDYCDPEYENSSFESQRRQNYEKYYENYNTESLYGFNMLSELSIDNFLLYNRTIQQNKEIFFWFNYIDGIPDYSSFEYHKQINTQFYNMINILEIEYNNEVVSYLTDANDIKYVAGHYEINRQDNIFWQQYLGNYSNGYYDTILNRYIIIDCQKAIMSYLKELQIAHENDNVMYYFGICTGEPEEGLFDLSKFQYINYDSILSLFNKSKDEVNIDVRVNDNIYNMENKYGFFVYPSESNKIQVFFNLQGGSIISGKQSQTITKGNSAIIPIIQPPEHYVLKKWDKSANDIFIDTEINAIYEKENI